MLRSDEPSDSQEEKTHPLLIVQWWAIMREPFVLLRDRLQGERCPNCGVRVRAEIRQCTRCGIDLQPVFSRPRPQPVTLEAIGVFALLVVLAAFYGWPYVAPVVYGIAPGFRATKTGPEGFPVVVRINESGLRITNGSDDRWNCRLWLLPQRPAYSAGVVLAPLESRDLPYADFTAGARTLTNRAGYTRARQQIRVECFEDSGRPHLIYF